ncbi:hypothetical protein J7K42_00295 [bacterium]|nr:hypothetical protein [bacterium]
MTKRLVWRFLVKGEEVEVESGETKEEALFELGKALGVGSPWSKEYTLRLVRKLNPKLIGKPILV